MTLLETYYAAVPYTAEPGIPYMTLGDPINAIPTHRHFRISVAAWTAIDTRRF